MVCNLSDDTEALYGAEYFEKQEETKYGYTTYLSSPVASLVGKFAFAALFAKAPGRHLDLGCADGSLMEIFAAAGFTTRGLEISKHAVGIAQSKGLDVDVSRLHGFPAGQPTSDLITVFDVLEHVDQPGATLRAITENLHDEGYCAFSTLSVRSADGSDYWFNNCLEHYVYYDRDSLTFVLTEAFGAGNFDFIEVEIAGIAEFWGCARKSGLSWERDLLGLMSNADFRTSDSSNGYLLSLFYNQLARFDKSAEIVECFATTWPTATLVQAQFYLNYVQGKYERAVTDARANAHVVPISQGVFWQAFAHAEREFAGARQQAFITEYDGEIEKLRETLSKTKRRVRALKEERGGGAPPPPRPRAAAPPP
ncbi:MAG: class I SAM-dependent methyltransferase, partial [Sporichthyaceae bacterium]